MINSECILCPTHDKVKIQFEMQEEECLNIYLPYMLKLQPQRKLKTCGNEKMNLDILFFKFWYIFD